MTQQPIHLGYINVTSLTIPDLIRLKNLYERMGFVGIKEHECDIQDCVLVTADSRLPPSHK